MAAHFLVIGATGPSGLAFCEAALEAGHQITIYARNPAKIPTEITDQAKVDVVKGQLDDEAALKRAVGAGASVFVSFAGPVASNKGTPVTDSMKILFPLLIAARYERAFILGTVSWTAPQDQPALKWKAMVGMVKLVGGSAYEECNGLGAFVGSTDINQLNWTLFRVPLLGNGETKPVKASFGGSGQDGLFLTRRSIADWILQEMQEKKWVGKAPMLCN
ncbi:hypothetical protein FQN54_001139 [Arachnomyces sp. PD_36]|nr:hypothetical protein FQN54_001139 [Arachnomyces sp. PD_36]